MKLTKFFLTVALFFILVSLIAFVMGLIYNNTNVILLSLFKALIWTIIARITYKGITNKQNKKIN